MLLPCDLREWVAKDDLVHFVLEAVNAVDMTQGKFFLDPRARLRQIERPL